MTDGKKITEIQKSAQRNEKTKKYFSIFLVVIIAVFFLILAFENLFNIKEVKVDGISAAVPYNAEDVTAFLDIQEGTNLITYDSDKAKRSLLYQFPYIEKIEIKKRFPSTLVINITENKGTLYVKLGEDNFILSSNGRVLEIVDDPFYDGKSRTELVAEGVKRCVCGEDIVFDKNETLEILSTIAGCLDSYGLSDKITRLDIRDKFDVRLMYDNRFEIKFGIYENAENKIELFSHMINNKIWEDTTGIIDISDGSEALVKFTGNVAN